MSSLFIDTNLLIYLKSADSPFHDQALALMDQCIKNNDDGIITPYVINEFHYYLVKKFSSQYAQDKTGDIFSLPNLSFKDFTLKPIDLVKIIKLSTKYSLKTFDAFHAYYCKILKINKIATFDTDFDRIPWLTRVPQSK
jgi:predicted nucleic acid-binding protein